MRVLVRRKTHTNIRTPPPSLPHFPPSPPHSLTELPDAPTDVTLHVSSNRSLTVKFSEPVRSKGAPITRYKSKPQTDTSFLPPSFTSASPSLPSTPLPPSSSPPSSVEWCRGSDQFSPIVGEFVLTDLRANEYIIPDLNKVGGASSGRGGWVELHCS